MKKLTPEEERVILLKGTEAPFSGKYYRFNEDGTYSCKQCGSLLYNSSDKFDSGSRELKEKLLRATSLHSSYF